MTTEQYLKAVSACPRVSWASHSFNVLTKQSRDYVESGYVVGNRRGFKRALVPDVVLTDRDAIRRLASGSTSRRIEGFIVRPMSDLDPTTEKGPLSCHPDKR